MSSARCIASSSDESAVDYRRTSAPTFVLLPRPDARRALLERLVIDCSTRCWFAAPPPPWRPAGFRASRLSAQLEERCSACAHFTRNEAAECGCASRPPPRGVTFAGRPHPLDQQGVGTDAKEKACPAARRAPSSQTSSEVFKGRMFWWIGASRRRPERARRFPTRLASSGEGSLCALSAVMLIYGPGKRTVYFINRRKRAPDSESHEMNISSRLPIGPSGLQAAACYGESSPLITPRNRAAHAAMVIIRRRGRRRRARYSGPTSTAPAAGRQDALSFTAVPSPSARSAR